MSETLKRNEFDVIIIGSGTCGATIARELSKEKKKVLILEQGANQPLKETFSGISSIAQEVPLADNIKALRAITTGGSTALYFAVSKLPPLEIFLSLGIDLSKELEEVKKELPLTEFPDELFPPQSIRLRQSMEDLGYSCKKNMFLIDKSKCTSGYSYEAKWKARSYVEEAIKEGAALINQAKVTKVLVEKNQAIGVEYKLKSKTCQAYGTKIILASGSLSSPVILRNSGIKDVVNRGFYCKPGFVMFGIVPGLKGKESFVGSMDADFEEGGQLGDTTMSGTLFKMLMLQNFKLMNISSHAKTISLGVMIHDGMGGELRENGKYHKKLTEEEIKKFKRGEEAAKKILKNAGATKIFKSGISGSAPGGVIRIKEHVDEKLQTKFRNLYVCDASLISEDMDIPPTLTLVCLSKYLAKHVLSSL